MRIFSGAPRIAVSSSSTIITSFDFNLRETIRAIFSRVYSSNTTNILIVMPLLVRSKIKSRPHTSLLSVHLLRKISDSTDPILRFFPGIFDTFKPSSPGMAQWFVIDAPTFSTPKSLACIANHFADACVRVRVSALQDAFNMCSQQVFFAAHFDVGQPRDMLVVARLRK